jgi:hypothetical protein
VRRDGGGEEEASITAEGFEGTVVAFGRIVTAAEGFEVTAALAFEQTSAAEFEVTAGRGLKWPLRWR